MNTINTTNVLAFTFDAAMYCTDHGAAVDTTDLDECEHPHPVMNWESDQLNAVEYCDHGHSFCGNCGTDLEGKGHPDSAFAGNFARCWNCSTESVYVDGEGYVSTYRWSDVLDVLKVKVYGPTVTYQTDLNGYTPITAAVDESGTNICTLRAYVTFLDVNPSAGCVLVLVNGDTGRWTTAYEAAVNYWDDNAEGFSMDSADDRASVQLVEVPTDQVWFNSKR